MELLFLPLLLCVIAGTSLGESDEIHAVEVKVSGDAIIPCQLQPPVGEMSVEWTRNGTFVHVFRSKADDLVNQDEHFKGRTSLFHKEMPQGNVSLKLTNVTKDDEGNYICSIRLRNSKTSDTKKCNITLNVENAPGPSDPNTGNTPKLDHDKSKLGNIVIVIVIVIVITALIGFVGICIFIWKTLRNSNGVQQPAPGSGSEPDNSSSSGRNRGGRNRRKNKDKNNPETVELKKKESSSETST